MRNETQLVMEHSINASRGNLANLAAKTREGDIGFPDPGSLCVEAADEETAKE